MKNPDVWTLNNTFKARTKNPPRFFIINFYECPKRCETLAIFRLRIIHITEKNRLAHYAKSFNYNVYAPFFFSDLFTPLISQWMLPKKNNPLSRSRLKGETALREEFSAIYLDKQQTCVILLYLDVCFL